MTEQLAIKTDQADEWRKKKVNVASRCLKPRTKDGGLKSSWAHDRNDAQLREILSAPSKATRKIQALALFLFAELANISARRNRVLGVSIIRSVLDQALVTEDEQPHPVNGLSTTHRSLALESEAVRQRVASDLIEREAFLPWEYSREEMAEMLQELLSMDCIRQDLKPQAIDVLKRWSE